jgi:hypothetical protein
MQQPKIVLVFNFVKALILVERAIQHISEDYIDLEIRVLPLESPFFDPDVQPLIATYLIS